MATLDIERLTPRLRLGLADVARRLAACGVEFVVGGSAMLACRGVDVTVGDLDVCVSAEHLENVCAAFGAERSHVSDDAPDPWKSAWLLATAVDTSAGPVPVDVMGDLAIVVDGVVVHFPARADDVVAVSGVPVAFDSMWHWYHLYRVHDPARAALIAAVAGPEHLDRAGADLGL